MLSVIDTGRFVIAVPLPASRKPEMKPLIETSESCAGTQGLTNTDWIAVWFPRVTRTKGRVSKGVSIEEWCRMR